MSHTFIYEAVKFFEIMDRPRTNPLPLSFDPQSFVANSVRYHYAALEPSPQTIKVDDINLFTGSCNVELTFYDPKDAMLWKLAHGGEA